MPSIRKHTSHLARRRILRRLMAAGAAACIALISTGSLAQQSPQSPQSRQTLQVAAAADLAVCMDELNAAFSRSAPGITVKSTIGASGNFHAQIRNGAPYDVFLSADLFYPRELARAGLAQADSLFVYAHGRLVLWTADPRIDVAMGLRVLADPSVRRIAIANPDVAPYGRAAKAALEGAGLWQAVQAKLVFGENVAQAVQFVATGNAQVGLISAAHARAPGRADTGKAWEVPSGSFPLIEQGAIVTVHGRDNPSAAAYLAFMRSAPGRDILRRHGFGLPPQPRG
jgi:molybdate transport system substrate-binding protein